MPDIHAPLAQQIARTIATEIGAQPAQAGAAIALLDEGATVPFIARYRKEATGGLDDSQLRTLETRLTYLRELEERRTAVLASIQEQGKLTDELRRDIEAADSKARLEDLYLPYKPKRRTRAQIAREAGLEPLADGLLADPTQSPETAAEPYVNAEKGVADVKAALEGARAILMERWGENAALIGELRSWLEEVGIIHAKVAEGKETEGVKYRDYFDHSEVLAKIPSHRLLALFRAQREQVLSLELEPGPDAEGGHVAAEGRVARHAGVAERGRAADRWLLDACRLTWRAKLHVHLQLDLFGQARERAEAHAIKVFGENLKDLLLAAPAGPRTVLGLDPGLRTGVKVAVVDRTGKLVAADTIYPHAPKNQWEASLATLGVLCVKHSVELIAIGNGTASRETDKLAGELVKQLTQLKMQKIVVSEAGASVYSASELAAKEFPELDVSLRGAVSIARRLQDPLAELVKIEPKAIGVGQYQHDVNPVRLAKALDSQVEDCVNAVGVHVNTASAALLARVSGLSSTVAENIIRYRDEKGAFTTRKTLLEVPRLGPKVFEQCAGFLRIDDGEEPLDGSAVHPEAYPVVQRIVKSCGREVKQLIGDGSFLRTLKPESFTDETFGVPTVRDILKELEKPGRDPRPEFRAAQFAEGVEDLKDLKPGMILEGVVTNVAAFGAFVDIGVHQDGLVHISALADTFVKDPRDVVKAGDIVKVRVLEVDLQRKRIALSRRLEDRPVARPAGSERSGSQGEGTRGTGARGAHPGGGSGDAGRGDSRPDAGDRGGGRGDGGRGADTRGGRGNSRPGAGGGSDARGDAPSSGGFRGDGPRGGDSSRAPTFRGNDATRAAAARAARAAGSGGADASRSGSSRDGAPRRGDSARPGGFRDGKPRGTDSPRPGTSRGGGDFGRGDPARSGAPRGADSQRPGASRGGGSFGRGDASRQSDTRSGAGGGQSKQDSSFGNDAMAEAFARAKRGN